MGDKARDPRARIVRGRVLYLPYIPYLGMVYVICVTAESNYFAGAIATVMSLVPIVTCYGSRDLYNIKP